MSKRDISVDRNTITVKVTLRLLPNQTFNSSLGDYTQWMHLACPHWFGSTVSVVCSAWVKKVDFQTAADCQQSTVVSGTDTSILHHAFISIFIALWAVITCYVILLMPILSYFTRFRWRGRMPAAGQYNTCLVAPAVTRKGHDKIEPKAKHFSHCKKDQSSRPNQTDNSKRLAKIT